MRAKRFGGESDAVIGDVCVCGGDGGGGGGASFVRLVKAARTSARLGERRVDSEAAETEANGACIDGDAHDVGEAELVVVFTCIDNPGGGGCTCDQLCTLVAPTGACGIGVDKTATDPCRFTRTDGEVSADTVAGAAAGAKARTVVGEVGSSICCDDFSAPYPTRHPAWLLDSGTGARAGARTGSVRSTADRW